MRDCLFCSIVSGQEEGYIVYENEWVCCFLDKYPINKGHTLIVPKKHYTEFSDVDEKSLEEVMKAAQRVAGTIEGLFETDGITVMQNNGIFKDVDHYHMHVVPRFKDDGFAWIEPVTDENIDFELLKSQFMSHLL